MDLADQPTPATPGTPSLLILNQMAGPMTWELAEDLGNELGCVALLTGHPDTLVKTAPGVLLHAAPAYQRGSFTRRAFSWVLYMLRAFFWLWRFPRTTPVLLFSNPPILCWLGWLMRLLRGQKYAVMVHDIYPDVLVRLQGMPEKHPLIRAWRWLNRRAYNRAQVVMTLGEYMAENLARQFDPTRTPAGKVEVVYPWVDTERIKPIPKEENWFAQKYGQVGKLTVMYSGNMGLGHDIETMVEAARLLKDEPDIHFMFIGAGPKWQMVKKAIEKHELSNISLLEWQMEEKLPYSLATADISLMSLEQRIEGMAIPSKAIYSLAAGSALVGLGKKDNDISVIVDKYHCGVNIVPGDVKGLADALTDFYKSPNFMDSCKENAHLISESIFSRNINVKRMASLLSELRT